MRIQSDKLLAMRKKAGLSILDLTRKTGIHASVLEWYEKAGYADAEIKTINCLADAIGCYFDDIIDMTSSHSEKQVLEGCIALMQELTGYFEEWLEYHDFEVDEDETFFVTMSYFHIVQRLFLWNTGHSGGTSTGLKCGELGVDSSKHVAFGCYPDEDEEVEDDDES